MAYNVLDGKVDYSTTEHPELVDAGANQIIKGTKTIVGTLLAKDGREIVPPAIAEIEGGMKNAILTYQSHQKAKAEFNLTFDGDTLKTKKVRAERFDGSGEGLSNLPANQFKGLVGANFLNIGHGLKDVRTRLQIDTADGLRADEDGLSIATLAKGGLSFRNKRLVLDPKNCPTIMDGGQNLSDEDLVLVHDLSRGDTRNTTLGNLFDGYIQTKLPQAAGPPNSIQLKASNGFAASSAFTFNPRANLLNVDGRVVTDSLTVTGKTDFEGPVAKNIKTVSIPDYEIQPGDYTVLCDTARHKVTATLPPACDNEGRVIIIKKINSDKFKLKSHLLTITTEEAEIDFKKSIEVKFSYSTHTIQSDGKKWWIIGKTGS